MPSFYCAQLNLDTTNSLILISFNMQFLPDVHKWTLVYVPVLSSHNNCESNWQPFFFFFAPRLQLNPVSCCICGCGVLLLIELACHHIRANCLCAEGHTHCGLHWFHLHVSKIVRTANFEDVGRRRTVGGNYVAPKERRSATARVTRATDNFTSIVAL